MPLTRRLRRPAELPAGLDRQPPIGLHCAGEAGDKLGFGDIEDLEEQLALGAVLRAGRRQRDAASLALGGLQVAADRLVFDRARPRTPGLRLLSVYSSDHPRRVVLETFVNWLRQTA